MREIARLARARRVQRSEGMETIPTAVQDAAHVKTIEAGESLEVAARAFERHSGPESTARERALFGQDLRAAAMCYARAYYAEARAYGLIPEAS